MFRLPNRWIFFPVLMLIVAACRISTTSRQWKIRYDHQALAFREQLLERMKQQPHRPGRPNVILIMADDLGKYDISTYGASPVQTPNIDRLASEGVLFRDAYVTAPICSPSRAAILTGKYPQRFGFETQPMEFYPSNIIEYNAGKNAGFLGDWKVATPPDYPAEWEVQHQGIPLTEITMAEWLQAAGYRTAITGKWHLGTSPAQIPNRRGFDYQYGFYGAFSIYTPSQKSPGYRHYIQDDFSARYQWNMERRTTAAVRRNDRVITEKEYLTFAIRDEAIRFLEQNRDSTFFLYIPFNAPHVPFQAPDAWCERFAHVKDPNKQIYYAMIAALDDAVGDILSRVKELGLEENTIIWFLSDNGGASYTGATDNGPLKGGKLTYFEGGINVPFMVKWTGHLPAGTSFTPPVTALDIFTSTMEACGVGLPAGHETDGVNLFPYITGTREASSGKAVQGAYPEKAEETDASASVPHERFYWRADHIRVIRVDDWKLILSTRDQWLHLYNLSTDRSETIDLRTQEPQRLRQLEEYFDQWDRQLPEKPLWPRIMDRRFIIGGMEYYFPA